MAQGKAARGSNLPGADKPVVGADQARAQLHRLAALGQPRPGKRPAAAAGRGQQLVHVHADRIGLFPPGDAVALAPEVGDLGFAGKAELRQQPVVLHRLVAQGSVEVVSDCDFGRGLLARVLAHQKSAGRDG